VKTRHGWFERAVCVDGEDRLAFGISAIRIDDAPLPAGHASQPAGQIFECAPARLEMLRTLARRLKRHGGFALFIDYGHSQPGFGDTLQAVKSQKYAGVFDHPGEADLTSHVDFASLAETARHEGLFAHEVINQGAFLKGCGIAARASALKSAGSAATAQTIDSALRRLTDDSEMGSLFRVLCISSAPVGLPPLKIQH
jgi:SAM-dependent MidA family methyltransferase